MAEDFPNIIYYPISTYILYAGQIDTVLWGIAMLFSTKLLVKWYKYIQ